MITSCERRSLSKTAFGAAWCGCFAVLVLAAGCKTQAPDTRAADAQTIRDLDAQWSKTAAAHDVDGTVSYYSDDAAVMPPNGPLLTDKREIRAGWADMLGPSNHLSWQTTRAEVAASGDVAYSLGTYSLTMQDAQGKPIADHGKYLCVWKKQADGKWKSVADTWNSDLPVAAPEPVAAKKK
jgi:ketosteroid isomerase-like protein